MILKDDGIVNEDDSHQPNPSSLSHTFSILVVGR